MACVSRMSSAVAGVQLTGRSGAGCCIGNQNYQLLLTSTNYYQLLTNNIADPLASILGICSPNPTHTQQLFSRVFLDIVLTEAIAR